jgi:prophage regulatory protein
MAMCIRVITAMITERVNRMTRLIRVDEVLRLTGLAKRTMYQEISAGRFPSSVPISTRAVGWSEEDVNNWIKEKIALAKATAA